MVSPAGQSHDQHFGLEIVSGDGGRIYAKTSVPRSTRQHQVMIEVMDECFQSRINSHVRRPAAVLLPSLLLKNTAAPNLFGFGMMTKIPSHQTREVLLLLLSSHEKTIPGLCSTLHRYRSI